MSSFTVAIVGRPNVGKSTLFNRLIGRRDAIVDDLSGVTRDRQYGTSVWNGKPFNVIDTGGFVPRSKDVFEKAIREQVAIAISEASLLIFMVDVTCGITDLDEEMMQMLRRTDKPVIVSVNKVDNSSRLFMAQEFYSMGFEHMFFLSSITGSGTGEMLDRLVEFIPDDAEENLESELPHFAIVGQPNVGKSSLTNALVGENRNIVSDIAGTTRDSIHTRYNMFQKDFFLIDTAGIRKKASTMENLEFYSVIRAIKAIDEADVCLLMIDAQTGIEAQDMAIFSLIQRKRKGVVVLVNKWDLLEKETNTAKEYTNHIKSKLAPFTDVPVVFISALEKQRVFRTIEEALLVAERRKTKIKTSELNEFLEEVLIKHSPPSVKGKHIRIKYVTQLPTYYPSFAFFCNHPQYVKEPYRNYIENRLRERFDLTGVPISVYFRKK